jgi:CRISPR/Cas system-associated protein Cas5 (RAMP superfamily)
LKKVLVNRFLKGVFDLSEAFYDEYYKAKGVEYQKIIIANKAYYIEPDSILDTPLELIKPYHLRAFELPKITDREDLIAVEIVERLREKASGSCSIVYAMEIPKDVKYDIEGTKGVEIIVEKHRIW